MKYELAKQAKTPCKVILPKGIEDFMHEKIGHPIVYDRFQKKAFCFLCGRYFDYAYPGDTIDARTVHVMDRFKAGDSITCPLCGHHGRAIPHTRNCNIYRTAVTGRREKDKIYITFITAIYSFKDEQFSSLNKKVGKIYLDEIIRVSRKSQDCYLSWSDGWTKADKPYVHHDITASQPIFHPSLEQTIDRGFLKHCNIDVRYTDVNSLVKKICLNAKYPQLEYLKKAGLKEIETAMIYDRPTYLKLNWKKADLPRVLGITGQDIDKLKQWDMWNIDHIAAFKQIKKFHPKVKKRDMTDFFTFFTGIGLFVAKQQYNADLKGLDPVRTAKYLEKLYQENPPGCANGVYGYTRSNVIREYGDYIRQLQDLDYPMTNYYLYPKDFFAAHNKISEELRRKKDQVEQMKRQKEQKRYEEKYLPALQKLAWGEGKYFIRPLVDYNDFSTEGKNNTNCVASYYERATKGQSAIFVIREKLWPDKSLATVEVIKDQIVQCRAKGNVAPDTEVRAFADKWIREVVNAKKQKGAA